MKVSCFGSHKDQPARLYAGMKLAGELLAVRGIGIATGAFGGIGMRAAPEGAAALAHDTPIIGYTYGAGLANPFISEAVDCEMLAGNIPFAAGYCVRLAGLLSSDGFIIAGGGGAGTFLELIATINFNQKFWRPMKRAAILEMHSGGGWDQSMLDALKAWGVLSDEVAATVRIVDSAEKAVRWVCDGAEL